MSPAASRSPGNNNNSNRRFIHTPHSSSKRKTPLREIYDSFGFLKDGNAAEEYFGTESYVRPESEQVRLWNQILGEWEQWQDGRLQYLVICEGLPSSLRPKIWQRFLHVDKFKSNYPGLYQTLLVQNGDPQFCDQIRLDITRTFATHKLFRTSNGREQLFNILKAYSIFNPEVGYCQGMSYVCGTLLMHMPEEEAFWTMLAIMDIFHGNYHPSMHGILEGNDTFFKLLGYQNPFIQAHLAKIQSQTLIFTSRWFLTLFTDIGNWQTVLRLWDAIFYEGKGALLRIALAIICCAEKQLLQCNLFEEVTPFLLNLPKDIIQPKFLLPALFRVDLEELHQLLQKNTSKIPEPEVPVVSTNPSDASLLNYVSQLWDQFNETPVKLRSTAKHDYRLGFSFGFLSRLRLEEYTDVAPTVNIEISSPTRRKRASDSLTNIEHSPKKHKH